MAGYFDFFRRVWGWLSSNPASAAVVGRTYQLRWSPPSREIPWEAPDRAVPWEPPPS